MPECISCSRSFDIVDFLAGIRGYSTLTDSGVALCPHCHAELEFRARTNSLQLGYTYFGGSLHFECLVEIAAHGLRQHREGNAVAISFQGTTYSPPAG